MWGTHPLITLTRYLNLGVTVIGGEGSKGKNPAGEMITTAANNLATYPHLQTNVSINGTKAGLNKVEQLFQILHWITVPAQNTWLPYQIDSARAPGDLRKCSNDYQKQTNFRKSEEIFPEWLVPNICLSSYWLKTPKLS